MSGIIAKLISLVTGDIAGKTVGTAVNLAGVATLAPVALWFIHNKDEIAWHAQLTWGDIAVLSLVGWFILKLIHWTKSPLQ